MRRFSLTIVLLAACGSPSPPAASTPGPEQPAPTPAEADAATEQRLLEALAAEPADDVAASLWMQLSEVRARRAERECVERGEVGGTALPPAPSRRREGEECPDYRDALEALERLLRDHPQSPQAAASLEMVGYFRTELGRDDAAVVAWLSLVCPSAAPDPLAGSARVPEPAELEAGCRPRATHLGTIFMAWLRLANHLFEYAGPPDDLERTAAAYRRAIAAAPADAEHLGYARYKLAWTLYRLDRFADAFAAFAAATDEPASSELVREAVQYMAIIASEEDWDLDGALDRLEPLDRPEVARVLTADWPRTPDVLAALGDTLVDMARYPEAVTVYERFLSRHSGHRLAPDVSEGLRTARARCDGGAAPGFTCGVGVP